MIIVDYPDREALAIGLADRMASDLETALQTEPRALLAVPGGTSPAPIFDTLSGVAHLAWDRVSVLLTDERWVPEDSDRSNGRLIKQHLITNAASKAAFIPYFVEGQSPEEAAGPLSDKLAAHMPISVLLLGMGADMHTASLFPGADGLEQGLASDAPILVPIRAEGQEPRISLSAMALNGAMSKHLLIFGDDKRDALLKAQTLPDKQAPIAAVLNDMTVHWAA
jgi:6-phosphogluconolactonase